jgi:filamentous hemagglutinin
MTPCIIDERKLDYLFNVNIKPDAHNSKRALQNRQQLSRLGFDDDPEFRQLVQTHLEKTVQDESNIVKRVTESFINKNTGEEDEVDTEIRDSLLAGRTGKFAQLQSSWEVLPDGTRRFLSAIIYGK